MALDWEKGDEDGDDQRCQNAYSADDPFCQPHVIAPGSLPAKRLDGVNFIRFCIWELPSWPNPRLFPEVPKDEAS